MNEKSLTFLKSLISAPSPSGYEQPAAAEWRRYAGPLADSIDHDLHGNSFAVKNPQGNPKIMFAGHCDELGFIVKYIDERGFVFFDPIGGHDLSIVPGRRVSIINAKGTVPGVTGKKAIHLMTPDERKKVPNIENLWIDIGVDSREEALEIISVGDPVVYELGFRQITNDVAASRAFDDKVGAFAVIEALRYLKDDQLQAAVYSVATVQEEIGLRGAHTSTFSVEPVVGIAVDVTHATDHPEINKLKSGEILLGGGPVITRGANANPKVVELLMLAAYEEDIPYQVKANPRGTGTDANAMQLSRGGVAAALIGIPLRYMHTPSEMVNLNDVENTAKLLAAFARRVTSDMDFRP